MPPLAHRDLFRLDGKVAVVVGAGSGIGEAVALGLGVQGAALRCLDLDGEAADSTHRFQSLHHTPG